MNTTFKKALHACITLSHIVADCQFAVVKHTRLLERQTRVILKAGGIPFTPTGVRLIGERQAARCADFLDKFHEAAHHTVEVGRLRPLVRTFYAYVDACMTGGVEDLAMACATETRNTADDQTQQTMN